MHKVTLVCTFIKQYNQGIIVDFEGQRMTFIANFDPKVIEGLKKGDVIEIEYYINPLTAITNILKGIETKVSEQD